MWRTFSVCIGSGSSFFFAVVLAVLWTVLAACVVGSVIYDVTDWISAW